MPRLNIKEREDELFFAESKKVCIFATENKV